MSLDGGSSPLSRGIPAQVAGSLLIARIIPALAGNTTLTLTLTRVCSDHPRSRGEYSNTMQRVLPLPDHPRSRGEYQIEPWVHIAGAGSSPLSRGIP